MKKTWLIPILLTTTSLPLVAVTGCGNKLKEPHYDEEVGIEIYQDETLNFQSEFRTFEKDKTYKVCLDFKEYAYPEQVDWFIFCFDNHHSVYFEVKCDYIIQTEYDVIKQIPNPDFTQTNVWFHDEPPVGEDYTTDIMVGNKKTSKTKLNFYITFYDTYESIRVWAHPRWIDNHY